MSAREHPAPPVADAEVVDADYPVTPVPAHARKSFFSIAVVLLGFTVFTPTMLAGATLGRPSPSTTWCSSSSPAP